MVERRDLYLTFPELGEVALQVSVQTLNGHTHSKLIEHPELAQAFIEAARVGLAQVALKIDEILKEPVEPTIKAGPYD